MDSRRKEIWVRRPTNQQFIVVVKDELAGRREKHARQQTMYNAMANKDKYHG